MRHHIILGSFLFGFFATTDVVCAKDLFYSGDAEANAQSSVSADIEKREFSIGGGIGMAPDYEGSDDYDPVPIVSFEYKTPHYILKSNRAGVELDVLPSDVIDFGPVVRYNFGRDDVEDDAVDRLREVDGTLEGGLFIGSGLPVSAIGVNDNGYLTGRLTVLADALGEGHEGVTVEARGSYVKPVSDYYTVIGSVSSTYASDDYMDSFFGIDADNASRSGLDEFDAEGGIKDVGLSIVGVYQLDQNWSVNGIGSYIRLLGDGADSPVTDDRGSENQFFVGLSASYSFD